MAGGSSWPRAFKLCRVGAVVHAAASAPASSSGTDVSVGGHGLGAQVQRCFRSLCMQSRGAEWYMRKSQALTTIAVVVMTVGKYGPRA